MRRHAKRYLAHKLPGLVMILLSGIIPSAIAQKTEQTIPLVAAGTMPLYPRIALAARIQGVVKIRVTTDGKKIASLQAESGPPMLVKAAEENLRTWKFEPHKPTSLVVTFRYRLMPPCGCDSECDDMENQTVLLQLPTKVDVNAKAPLICDPAVEIKPHP